MTNSTDRVVHDRLTEFTHERLIHVHILVVCNFVFGIVNMAMLVFLIEFLGAH